jgi:hypothetical protein
VGRDAACWTVTVRDSGYINTRFVILANNVLSLAYRCRQTKAYCRRRGANLVDRKVSRPTSGYRLVSLELAALVAAQVRNSKRLQGIVEVTDPRAAILFLDEIHNGSVPEGAKAAWTAWLAIGAGEMQLLAADRGGVPPAREGALERRLQPSWSGHRSSRRLSARPCTPLRKTPRCQVHARGLEQPRLLIGITGQFCIRPWIIGRSRNGARNWNNQNGMEMTGMRIRIWSRIPYW